MKISSIQDVLEAMDDAPIYAFKATLKTIRRFVPADSAKPDSQNFQAATFTNGSKELSIIFRNRPELPTAWKGKNLCILAKHTDQGWFGSKAKDNKRLKKDANGQPVLDATGNQVQTIERVLWVTGAAEVVLDGLEAPGQAQEPANVAGASTPSKPPISQPRGHAGEYLPGEDEENGDSATPTADKASKVISEAEALKEARRISAQTRNAIRIASRTARQCSDDYFDDYGERFTPEEMRVTRSSIFLRFRDEGVLKCLPSHPMAFKSVKASEPSNEQSLPDKGAEDNIPF